jgi:hypothetical protein
MHVRKILRHEIKLNLSSHVYMLFNFFFRLLKQKKESMQFFISEFFPESTYFMHTITLYLFALVPLMLLNQLE